jgi:hypothetical protein
MSRPERPMGLDIGDAAIQLLHPEGAPPEQPHGWTLAQAAEKVNHLTGTKAELLEAIAYLACQVHGYKRISNLDAALAISNIESTIARYRERDSRG